MKDETIKAASNKELATWYNNATTTSLEALGHDCRYYNQVLAGRYATEMEERSVKVPSRWEPGVFNGPGTWR